MGRRRQHDRQLPPRLRRKRRAYYYVPRVDGRQRWIPLGSDYTAALRRYYEIDGAPDRGTTIGDAMDAYARDVLAGKAPKTQADYARYAAMLRPVFGDVRLAAATPSHFAQYLYKRTARVSANREIAYLASVFRHAMRMGWVAANPCHGVPRNPERPRGRDVSDLELDAFSTGAGPLLAAYIRLKRLTGLRQGELLALRPHDLREDGIHIERPAKGGRRRIITWTPALRAAVDAVLALPPTARTYLWPARGRRPLSTEGFRSAWQRAMRAYIAGGAEPFREHDIRAAAVADLTLEHAQALAGHQSPTTTARAYRRRIYTVPPAQ